MSADNLAWLGQQYTDTVDLTQVAYMWCTHCIKRWC